MNPKLFKEYQKIIEDYKQAKEEFVSTQNSYRELQVEYIYSLLENYRKKLIKLTPSVKITSFVENFVNCDICKKSRHAKFASIDFPSGEVEFIYIEHVGKVDYMLDADRKNPRNVFSVKLSLLGKNQFLDGNAPIEKYYRYNYDSDEVSLYPLFVKLFDLNEKEINFEIVDLELILTHPSDKFRNFAKEIMMGL